jgi:L-threonylcarbamoyladenylate synthase
VGCARSGWPGPVAAAELGLEEAAAAQPGSIEAPGQLASHYAPSKKLRLDALQAAPDEWLIGFGAVAGHATLSARGNLTEAAAHLFDCLHQADFAPHASIAVAPIPEEGIGAAINDRLARAAAPR